MTAWNQTLQFSPRTTSPMTMPVSSMKHEEGIVGLMPWNERIMTAQ